MAVGLELRQMSSKSQSPASCTLHCVLIRTVMAMYTTVMQRRWQTGSGCRLDVCCISMSA